MFACNSPDDRFPWQASLGCTSDFFPLVTLTSISVSMNGMTGSLSQTVESTGGMNAYSIQVRLRSGDFPVVTTITTTVHTYITVTTTDHTSTTITTTDHTSITITLPVPGVTTTISPREIDLTSPSALVGAACSAAIFGVALLAILACFCIHIANSRSASYDRFVPRDPQEEDPLLGYPAIGYDSTGRAAARGRDSPPPYPEEASSRA